MEISNNLIQTTSQTDNPNPLSEESPLASKGAKKGQAKAGAAEFDGALAAMLMGAQASAGVPTKEPSAVQVDLSTKSQEVAKAAANGAAEKGVKFPNVEQTLQTKANQSAAGAMTGALVAGPNQPWSPNWVFGSELSQARASAEPGKESPLAALQALMAGKGGDEAQSPLTQAAPQMGASPKSANTEAQSALAALNSMSVQELEEALKQADASIAALSPMSGLVPVEGRAEGEQVRGNAPAIQSLSGAEYLNTLQGVKPTAMGGNAQNGAGFGEQGFGGQPGEGMAQSLAQAKGKSGVTPQGANLSLMPGSGLSSGKPSTAKKPGLEEGRLNPELTLGASVQNLMQGPNKQGVMKPNVITGHVVPGAMMKERLTNESLGNMSTSISGMSGAGGGEMRIKLNPGNLGELTIRVSTVGQQVGLQVQASDSGAKKILEESISSLKDSLANQNLSLGRVDISVAQPTSQSAQADNGSQQSPWNQGQQAQMGQSGLSDGSQGGSGRFNQEDSVRTDGLTANSRSRSNGNASNAFARQARATGPTGRLDVMA